MMQNGWTERIEELEVEVAKLTAERDADRRREYGYSQQTVDALTVERDKLKAANDALRVYRTVEARRRAELYAAKVDDVHCLKKEIEAVRGELAEARKEIAEQRTIRDNLLITNKELNDTLDSYAIICRGHSGTLNGIFNLRKRAETAEYLLSERENEIRELLYYVQNKYPGETRYETAKAALAGKEGEDERA